MCVPGKLKLSLPAIAREFLLLVNSELQAGNAAAAPSQHQSGGLAEQSASLTLLLHFSWPHILLSVDNSTADTAGSWRLLASAREQTAVLTPG